MRYGFFYDFSNYGSYERLTDDGLTQWHPAFLRLGNTLFGMRQEVQRLLPEVQTQTEDPNQMPLG
jgi:putative transposase